MIREFFGIGGYTRQPEGAYSWQHLTFVGALLVTMVVLAVWLGCRNRRWNSRTKTRVLVWAAILIDTLEIVKIGLSCYGKHTDGQPWYMGILYNLPLFLCSIQLIVIPLAAFTKGRLQEASADFVGLFGLLGAVFGTVGAAQNYNAYPVLGFDNVVSGLTHSISGFAALYVLIVGLAAFKRSNAWICVGMLLGFCGAAFAVNTWVIPRNYMFLTSHDGTPYQIVYDLVGGSPLWYPLLVVGLFVVYMAAFYAVALLLRSKKREKVTV